MDLCINISVRVSLCAYAEVIILQLLRSLSRVCNDNNRGHAQTCFQSAPQM